MATGQERVVVEPDDVGGDLIGVLRPGICRRQNLTGLASDWCVEMNNSVRSAFEGRPDAGDNGSRRLR